MHAERMAWFDRQFQFALPAKMFPFYLERLRGTYPRIAYYVQGVSEEILSRKPEGKWSIKEHIGHLAEVDIVSFKRVDEMLKDISPLSPAVFEPKDYSIMPIDEVLTLFRVNRSKNIKQYEELLPHQILKASLHPRLKQLMTPVDLAWFDAEHDDHHLATIHLMLHHEQVFK
jgi:hypothetical protein